MITNKVWLVTGAGRGMGLDIARAALTAGHNVVATGRNPDKVAGAVGKSANVLALKLDITNPADAESALKAVMDRFGRIDVLVNNAASFYAGYFEELTPGADAAANYDQPYRPYECHSRFPAGHAQAAFRPGYLHLVDRGPHRL